MKLCNLIWLYGFALAVVLGAGSAVASDLTPASKTPSAEATEGLVFWNRLGSAEEVQSSCVGPNGLGHNGTFVSGRFGNALELNAQYTPGVTFPLDLIPRNAGCIEFWARVTVTSSSMPGGPRVMLLGSLASDGSYYGEGLQFQPNDGTGNGGLCARVGGIGSAGTGTFGSWTYSNALKGGSIADWHHYALVWSVDQIPTLTNPVRRMAVYVDGVLNTGSWMGQYVPPSPVFVNENGKLMLLYLRDSAASKAAVDNVKVWNYAKTDFSDRFEEGPGITNKTFVISGSRGAGLPLDGTYSFENGTAVSATVTSPVTDGTTRFLCTGANVASNAFTAVSPTNVMLTLTNDAVLTWNWKTQYRLGVSIQGEGTVSSAAEWHDAGGELSLTATPASGWNFGGWIGSTNGCAMDGKSITVTMAQARSLTANFTKFSPVTETTGLVLWNRLGSAEEVQSSCVGPNGLGHNGTFVSGRFGNALELNAQYTPGVTFPLDLIPRNAGCIEFWARVTVTSSSMPGGPRVMLLGSLASDGSYYGEGLQFQPNDGTGNGGLCARVGGIGSAGTGTFGSWTYSNALKGGSIADWHHYALVWSVDQIPTLTNPVRRMAVYVDGVLNTGSWMGQYVPPSPVFVNENGKLMLLYLRDSAASKAAVDNVKVWNYAKTDFSDRFEESAGGIVHNLTIEEARGNAYPTNGVHAYVNGTAVSAYVPSPVTNGSTRYVCTGAAVSSNAFTQTCSTNVTLTLTNNATLTWNWRSEYELVATTSGNGSVTGGGWFAAGTSVLLTASPDTGYRFTGWSDGDTSASRTVLVPEGGATYTANFGPLPKGVFSFQKTFYSVAENAAVIKLTVERAEGSYGVATVDCSATSGSATSGADFTFDSTTLYWGNGVGGAKSIYVEIIDDADSEGNESFNVLLSGATGATLQTETATVTIVDNEGAPSRVPRFLGSLDFGEVATNATATRTVELWNDGNQTLTVTNVWVPDGFSVTQKVFSVPTGEAVPLTVFFTPTGLISYAGFLTLGCNATTGTTTCALSGAGTLPPVIFGTRKISGLTAMITIIVPDGSTALGVEDTLAPGLTPRSISQEGTWDAANRKVKWFFNEPGQIRDRVLTYTVDYTGSVVAGLVNFGSGNIPIIGDTVFAGGTNPGLLHPADDNGDWRIALAEAAACVTRWKTGVDDYKAPVVVRGITLYMQEERYIYDATIRVEAKRWVPLNNQSASSAQRAMLSAPLDGAVRTVGTTNVTIAVTPETGISAWGLEESIPEGIVVTAISNDGTWDALHRKIKWIFLDGSGRTLYYCFTGEAGSTVAVEGNASFDGSENSVTGDSVIAVPLSFQNWLEKRGLTGTEETLFSAMNAEYRQPNGFLYAFQSNLLADEPLITVRLIDGKPVIETPKQHESTLPYVDIQVIGTTDIGSAEWLLNLVPAEDQTGMALNRCKWETPTAPQRAFFRLKAVPK